MLILNRYKNVLHIYTWTRSFFAIKLVLQLFWFYNTYILHNNIQKSVLYIFYKFFIFIFKILL